MRDFCYTAKGVFRRRISPEGQWHPLVLRSKAFMWNAYPVCFEHGYEAWGVLRTIRNHAIFF